MAINRRKKVSGARPTRKPQRQPGRYRLVLRYSLSVVALAVAGYAVMSVAAALGAMPIERVVFDGDIKNADRAALVERVEPHLGKGFIGVDLELIQQQLLEDPWVFRAQVQRLWPGQLKVTITEQRPIARWGRGGLLNHRGELFVPERAYKADGLPLLEGPEATSERVMQQYQLMSQALTGTPLRLHNLVFDKSGNWLATVAGDSVFVLGREQPLKKLQRIIKVYRVELNEDFARVARIDARYANGIAVAWRVRS